MSSFLASASRSLPSLFNRLVDILEVLLGVYDDDTLPLAVVVVLLIVLVGGTDFDGC